MGCQRPFLGWNELPTTNLWKAVLAEFVVTVLYMILACGAILGLGFHEPSLLHTSLNTGFTVAVLASMFWHISGGHFNPAVSVALAVRGTISVVRCLLYCVAQSAGSIAGSGLLLALTPKDYRGNLGALFLHKDVHPGLGFLLEVLLTYVLIFTVISSTDPIKGFTGFQAPLAIGLSVSIGLLTGIPYTGAALNPIRALGPAVVMNKLAHHWIYWAGPIVGAVLACLTYDFVFLLNEEKPEQEKKITTESTRNLTKQAKAV